MSIIVYSNTGTDGKPLIEKLGFSGDNFSGDCLYQV
jgi:hypothetical protein